MSEDIQRWDDWFVLVGLQEEWLVVKEQFPDNIGRQLAWARIIELNRITSMMDNGQNNARAEIG